MSEAEVPFRTPRPFSKKLRRWALIPGSVFVFFIALFILLSPGLIKNYVNNHGKELVGRQLQIDKIKINYFTSTIQVIGANMFEQNGTSVFIGFDSMLVNLQPLRLLKNEITVQQFKLVKPQSQWLQNDTIFNFSDLLHFFASDEETAADAPNSESYALNLYQIEIKNGSATYADEQLDHTIEMKNVSFMIPHIYWGGAEKSKADVSFNLGSGGSISSWFNYSSETGDYSGEADLSQLDLKIILPYIQQYMQFSNMQGKVSAKILYNGNQNSFDSFKLSGEASIDSLSIFDQQGKKVVGTVHAKADLKNMVPMEYSAQIGTIALNGLYTYFALEDSLSNFEKMLVEVSKESPENDTTEEELAYNVTIDHLVIDQGLIDFSDQRFREVFNYELSEVRVDMDSLSLNTDWLNLNASMKLNKRGKLEAKVGINPYDPFKRVELEYVLSDFQLPDVNIYSKHYTGLPILFGEMYYVNKTTIIDRQLNSSNDLVIRNVELGRKGGGLYDVPIKLALFILKDINGDVLLNIPVTGDLSDPRTRIGKIIWNTFKGFMVKIVASPFKALGNLLGADPGELEEITFIYSDTTLVPKQRRSLDLLIELEHLKPEMQIELHYLNDRKLERTDAAKQIVEATYQSETGKEATGHRNDYMNFLKEKSGQDSMLTQDYEMLLAPAAQVDSIVLSRENLRIDQVKNYLISKNDSTQIRVIGYKSDEVLNIGSRPRFAISYVLKEEVESAKQ